MFLHFPFVFSHFPFVFPHFPFVFTRVPFVFSIFHSCSIRVLHFPFAFTRVPLVFSIFHSCSIRVLNLPFVFTRVPSVFPSVLCFRYDRCWLVLRSQLPLTLAICQKLTAAEILICKFEVYHNEKRNCQVFLQSGCLGQFICSTQ